MDHKPNTQNVIKTSCFAVVNSFETSNVKSIRWLLLRVVSFCLDPIIKIKLNFIFCPRTIRVKYTGSILSGFRRDCCFHEGNSGSCSCCRCHPERLALCSRREMEEMSSHFSLLTVTLMFQPLTVYFCSLGSRQCVFTRTDPLIELRYCFSWDANLLIRT